MSVAKVEWITAIKVGNFDFALCFEIGWPMTAFAIRGSWVEKDFRRKFHRLQRSDPVLLFGSD
jgi:hypothetical protein